MTFFAVKESVLDQVDRGQLDIELRLCRDLYHPNIISFLGHEFTERHLCIYLEFAEGGSIASMLEEFGPLPEPGLRRATAGILEGLDYLHHRRCPVVHRNIKGSNVLVVQRNPFQVKLTDFGSSRCDVQRSVQWMAPEVLNQQNGVRPKADIWSFGCTVIEMLTAEKPWGKDAFNSVQEASETIGNSRSMPPVPPDAPEMFQSLVRASTCRVEEERPSASDLLFKYRSLFERSQGD